MTERATVAQLRYLERLLASANTTWAMVRRRWPAAPARFDELDQQKAGALIATLRRHGHLPANHSLGGGPPKRRSADRCCAIASGGDNAIWVEHAVRGGRAVTAADAQRGEPA